MAELHPEIYFTVWAREYRDKPGRDTMERKDSYDTLEVAIEMGDELLDQGYVEYIVKDAKGKIVQHVHGD